jgi:rhamnosyltransferase
MPNHNNLGIAKALNIGCERALDDGIKWVLTMDQDSLFEKNKIKRYLKIAKQKFNDNSKLAIIAPNVGVTNKDQYCNKVITSGNILNLKAYQEVGGFNNSLFIDEVDHEICFRLIKKGFKILKLGQVHMKHQLGDTKEYKILFFKFSAMNHSYVRKYYIFRNRFLMRKRFPEFTKGYLKTCIEDMIKVILVEDDKIRKLKFILRGICDYKKGILGKCREE